MMVKKPDNTYDPNAVAVQTLHGQDLGYVPREHTARFPHDVTFGHVYSLGQNAKGLWGATVSLDSIPFWHCKYCHNSVLSPTAVFVLLILHNDRNVQGSLSTWQGTRRHRVASREFDTS